MVCLGMGTWTFADEADFDSRCSGIGSGGNCIQLGDLRDSAVLVGSFKSCTDLRSTETDISKENPDISFSYEFQVRNSTVVNIELFGVGDVWLLVDDNRAYVVGSNVDSIQRTLRPGRYTLFGRAPPCQNDDKDWRGRYKVLINLQGQSQSDTSVMENTQGSSPVSSGTSKEQQQPLTATSKWSALTYMWVSALGGFLFLLLLAAAG